MNILLLMMGGSGQRFGGDTPKQYMLFEGRPLFMYILESYAHMPFIDYIVVVSNADWLDKTKEWCDALKTNKIFAVVQGGENRSESVKNGLFAAVDIAMDDSVVLIHDATHPYVDREGTLKVIQATKHYGGATLGALSYDTVYKLGENRQVEAVLPRTHVISGASPEAFLFGKIYPVYMNATHDELAAMTSSGAIALENNIDFVFVETDILNLKITFPHDYDLFCVLPHDYLFTK